MRRRQTIFWVGLGIALVVVLEALPKPADTMFWRGVFNSGHVPLFGVGALVLLRLSLLWRGDTWPTRSRHYRFSFLATAALAVLSELAQYFSPRDADPIDALADVTGAVIALALAASFDRKLATERAWSRWQPRLLRAGAALILAASLTPLALLTGALVHRARAFPELCRFESFWDHWFLEARDGASYQLTAPPSDWPVSRGQVARVDFPVGVYPTFEVKQDVSDWRGYRALRLDLYSAAPDRVALQLRVHDRPHSRGAGPFQDRYNVELALTPGPNRIQIPLAEIERGPQARPMDLAQIESLMIFLDHPQAPVTLYLDDLRLE